MQTDLKDKVESKEKETDISILVLYNDEKLWLCTDTLEKVLGTPNSYTIIKTVLGSELVGFRYKSIFNIFGPKYLYSFSVFADQYVQNSSGTGLVHLAPLFGEDDMRVMKNNHYNDTYLPTFLVNSQVQFNISYIINEIDIKDKFGDTALDYAKLHKHTDIIKLFEF